MLTTQRDKFLGCGVAQQQLPRSPTSEIHESVGNHSSKPPRGSRAVVLLGSRVWRGHHWGGGLVLVSACLTVSPLITGGQAHTHTSLKNYDCLLQPICILLYNNKLCQTKKNPNQLDYLYCCRRHHRRRRRHHHHCSRQCRR